MAWRRSSATVLVLLKTSVLLAFVFITASCKTNPASSSLKDTPLQNPHLFEVIDNPETFTSLNTTERDTSGVKFAYFYGMPPTFPLAGKLVFLDPQKYAYHDDLMDEFPELENRELRETQVIVGNAEYLPSTKDQGPRLGYNVYGKLNPELFKKIVTKIQTNLKFELGKVGFILDYEATNASKLRYEKAGLEVFLAREFYDGINTETALIYNPEVSFGYLRYLTKDEVNAGLYSDQDILVLDSIPLDIAPVSGVLSLTPQVPNSHVILRTMNQKVPNAYEPWKISGPELSPYLGKLVKFTTVLMDKKSFDGHVTIEDETKIPDIKAQAEAYWKNRRPKFETPSVDLTQKSVWVWNKQGVKKELVKAYGSKATNFAIIDEALAKKDVDRSLYQQSFMVPFSFYDSHLSSKFTSKDCLEASKKCTKELGSPCAKALATCEKLADKNDLRTFMSTMLEPQNRQRMVSEPNHRREFLVMMQRLIREVSLPEDVLSQIRKAGEAYPPTVRLRLRSSTNAEDLAGLNGAGLYESKAACLQDGEKAKDDDGKASACRTENELTRIRKQIEQLKAASLDPALLKELTEELSENLTQKHPLSKAVRSVYASIWTERAFLSREYYGLDHQKVYMGILVHPSFVEESVNGVATLLFNPNNTYTINLVAQVDDISVTNPIFPDAIPYQTILTIKGDGKSISASTSISSSNLSKTRIISDELYTDVVHQLTSASSALKTVHGGIRYDLEFMIDAKGRMIVKQGRPL